MEKRNPCTQLMSMENGTFLENSMKFKGKKIESPLDLAIFLLVLYQEESIHYFEKM